MEYIFNRQDIEDRITVGTDEDSFDYAVDYSVPVELKSTLDGLIASGFNNRFYLLGDYSELKDNKITGYILLLIADSYAEPHKHEEIFNIAWQFDRLSKGDNFILG